MIVTFNRMMKNNFHHKIESIKPVSVQATVFLCLWVMQSDGGYKFSPHRGLVLGGGIDRNRVRKHEHLEGAVITKMTSEFGLVCELFWSMCRHG